MTEEKEDKVVGVLKYILQHEKVTGMPVTSDHIAQQFGVTPQQAAVWLNAYGPKRQKYLATMGDNTYRVSAKGLKRLRDEGINVEAFGDDGSTPPQVTVDDTPKGEVYAKLTTESDRFYKIGESLGVPVGTINTVTELVFHGDWQDPRTVWQVLKATPLKSDTIRAWFLLWMLMQKQAIPEELKGELPASPPEKELAKEHPFTPAATRFTVAGDQVVPDPDGAFTFSQALQVRGQNMGMSAPQAPPMPPQDKPSETISAFSNAMTAFSSTLGQKGDDPTQQLMLTIVKSLVERPQDNTMNQELLHRLERMEDKLEQKLSQPPPQPPQNPMEAASNQLGTMAHMMGFENVGALMGKLHSEGGGGARYEPQSFEQWLDMQGKFRGWSREDEDSKIKRDTTASMRQFVSNLAVSLPTAVQKFEALVKEGRGPAEMPEAPPRRVRSAQRPQVRAPEAEAPEEAESGIEIVNCGGCGKPFSVLVGATEATCPHCGIHLGEAPKEEEPKPEAPKQEAEEKPVDEVTPARAAAEAQAKAEAEKAEEPVAEIEEEPEAPATDRIEEAVESLSGDVETSGAAGYGHGVYVEEQPQAEEQKAAETEEEIEMPPQQPKRGKAKRKGGK